MESQIEEQELGWFIGRTSRRRLLTNAFRLPLSSAADELVRAPRRTVPAESESARAQVIAIRLGPFEGSRPASRPVYHDRSGDGLWNSGQEAGE